MRRLDPVTGVLRKVAYPVAPDLGGFDPWLMREVMVEGLPQLEKLLEETATPGGGKGEGVMRLLGAWGVEWIISPRRIVRAGPASAGLVEVSLRESPPRALRVWVHRIADPAPPVSIEDLWRWSPGLMETLEAVALGETAPVLLREESASQPTAGANPTARSARILGSHVTDTRITARVESVSGAVFVHTATRRNGWSARVGGRPERIFLANALHMAILVPPGTHDLEMVYRMPLARTGLAVTAGGVVLLALVALLSGPARRRGRAR
jgi:hypothetical protein